MSPAMLALIFAAQGQHAWQETRDPAFSGDFGELAMHNATSCMLFGAAQSGDWDYANDVGDACFELTNDLEIKTSLFVRLDTPSLTINSAPSNQYDGILDAGGAASTGNVFFADYQNRGLKVMLSTFWGQWLLFNEGADRNSTAYVKPTPTGSGIPVVISDTTTSGNFLWFEHDGTDSRIHSAVGALKIDSPLAVSISSSEASDSTTIIELSEAAGSRSIHEITSLAGGGTFNIELGTTSAHGVTVPTSDTEIIFYLGASSDGGLQFLDIPGQQNILAGAGVTMDTAYDTAVFIYKASADLWFYAGGSNN